MINTYQQTFQQQTTTGTTNRHRRARIIATNPTYFNWPMRSSTGSSDIIICSLQDQQSDQCRDCWTQETQDIFTSKFCSSLVTDHRLLTPDSLRRQLRHHYCYYPRETTKRFEKQKSSSSFGRGCGQRCFVGR